MPSKYSAENVAISGGGRVAIMRACAAIGQIHLGHFLPDYTAYAELLEVFRRFTPIPILLDPERGYDFSVAELEREIAGRGLGALLVSNPCNPTGKAILGEELAAWVGTARRLDCTLLLDEFYSHYLWHGADPLMSAAAYVEDVERDPVVIFDGLTKNWRYPGWRVTWTLGPSRVIEAIASAGSFLDGGGSRPLQRAALDVLTAEHARAEAEAIRRAFGVKRTLLVTVCARSVSVSSASRTARSTSGATSRSCRRRSTPVKGSSARRSPKRSSSCRARFFDVDPGQRRVGRSSRFRHHARFSFGPERKRRHDGARQARATSSAARAESRLHVRSLVRPIRGESGTFCGSSRLTSRETSEECAHDSCLRDPSVLAHRRRLRRQRPARRGARYETGRARSPWLLPLPLHRALRPRTSRNRWPSVRRSTARSAQAATATPARERRTAPAVVGLDKGALPLAPAPTAKYCKSEFKTVADIAEFVVKSMPPKAPGSLSAEEYYAILAFDLKANGIDLGDKKLDGELAKTLEVPRK